MTKPDPLVERIELDAAKQAQAARAGYAAEMKILRSEFSIKQREIAAKEKNELKRIERWRMGAVAAVEGRPVPLDDIRFTELAERSPGALRQERYVHRKTLKAGAAS